MEVGWTEKLRTEEKMKREKIIRTKMCPYGHW